MKTVRKVLLLAIGVIVTLNLAEILFVTLPGVMVGGPVPTCGVEAEGSPTGWPFAAFIPGCGSGKGMAFLADFVIDILIAIALVFGVWYLIRRRVRSGHV